MVCLCLSDDAAVRAVLLEGPDAAISGLAPGSLVIDFSTIAPATSEALAVRLAERGVAYLDAPVTGGTEGAEAGTLSVLVGGRHAIWSGPGRCWRWWASASATSDRRGPVSGPRR